MTSAELRALCDDWGVSVYQFCAVAGARPGTRPSWARDGSDVPVPPAVAALARVAHGVGGRLSYADLAALLRAEAARLDAGSTTK